VQAGRAFSGNATGLQARPEAKERAVATQHSKAKSASIAFSTKGQEIEMIQRVVAQVLGMAGCQRCGRLANLSVEFLGDPPPDLAKEGVTSIATEGF
jgi:hypothetical protein